MIAWTPSARAIGVRILAPLQSRRRFRAFGAAPHAGSAITVRVSGAGQGRLAGLELLGDVSRGHGHRGARAAAEKRTSEMVRRSGRVSWAACCRMKAWSCASVGGAGWATAFGIENEVADVARLQGRNRVHGGEDARRPEIPGHGGQEMALRQFVGESRSAPGRRVSPWAARAWVNWASLKRPVTRSKAKGSFLICSSMSCGEGVDAQAGEQVGESLVLRYRR